MKGDVDEIIVENTTLFSFYLSLLTSFRSLDLSASCFEQTRYSFVLKSIQGEKKVLLYG